jgi:hypothetical protein
VRRRPVVFVLFAVVAALITWALLGGREPSPIAREASPARAPAETTETLVAEADPSGGADPPPSPAVVAPAAPRSGDRPAEDDPFAGDANGWAHVDLEAVRAAMPDNIYWRMSAPTKDPDVLREREEERARWNVEYGKVLSGTATEEEIYAYYEHRDRLASDYVEFITHILESYGERLALRDIGLLKVAVELNLARLEEIPRQIAESLELRKEKAAVREAWLRDQAAFAEPPAER